MWQRHVTGKDARTFAADAAKMPDLLLMSKYLWRQGFLECPAACSADAGEAAVASCACACPLRGDVDDRAFWNASGPVPNSNLQLDFNVSVRECFDATSLASLRELDESNRSVQKLAESTSI